MITAKPNSEAKIDNMLKHVIRSVAQSTQKKNDDFLILCVGTTGTGKSSLMLHAYEQYDPEGCNIDYISFDKEGLANSLNETKKKPNLRFLGNDEANVSKREALTKFNRDLLDLYFAIRGLNIFHWWNNPSADMIDKPFLEERIKGMIVIFDKSKGRRVYFYLRKKDLLQLFEKYKNLKLKTIRKVVKKYAFYKGWFKAYDGKMWKEYTQKKSGRMVDKVADFYDKYGKNLEVKTYSPTEVGKMMGLVRSSFSNKVKIMCDNGKLIEGEDFFTNGRGRIYYQSGVDKIIATKPKMRSKFPTSKEVEE